MGAEVRVTIWTPDEAAADAAAAAVFAEFERLDALLSVWKPGSDVLRINAAAGQAPVAVSRETIEVVQAALMTSELTAGKFDITFGALADVWKFDHDQDNRVPTEAEIAARLPLVDFRAVHVDDRAGTIAIDRHGVRIHLGGIGKGYAVDRAIAILRGRGLNDFLIQSGGDLYAGGQPGDRPWKLGINDPRGAPDDSFATIELRDRTFSTSGDYERSFMKDGVRFHHLLDPDHRPARARLPQRDDRRSNRHARRWSLYGCLHPRTGSRHGTRGTVAGCRGGDRDRRQSRPHLERAPGCGHPAPRAHRRPVVSRRVSGLSP